jgi:CDP-diacylglycerol--serine O-phosphatidyltransferase
MISSVATYSWSSLRLRRNVRFEALAGVAVLFGALFSAPWETLTGICVVYLALIPLSIRSYAKVRRLRATAAASESSPA